MQELYQKVHIKSRKNSDFLYRKLWKFWTKKSLALEGRPMVPLALEIYQIIFSLVLDLYVVVFINYLDKLRELYVCM